MMKHRLFFACLMAFMATKASFAQSELYPRQIGRAHV